MLTYPSSLIDSMYASRNQTLSSSKSTNNLISSNIKNNNNSNRRHTTTSISILSKAIHRGIGAGITGASAMMLQVIGLMWMHTVMVVQYRHGGKFFPILNKLFHEGGIPRFYRGFTAGFFQGPLARFGDAAANHGTLALFDSYETTSSLPIALKTGCASFAAGTFRIILQPLDTIKCIMQVKGISGFSILLNKAKISGPSVFFHGGIATAAATTVGHYPWFVTFNYFDHNLPNSPILAYRLLRNSFIGISAAIMSDMWSNPLRVLKTYRQTNSQPITYYKAFQKIVAKDGIQGIFTRGLGTRILTHSINSIVFTVLWKLLQEQYERTSQRGYKSRI